MNFRACNRRHMLRSKLEGEKVVPESRRGCWLTGLAALNKVNEPPSLASLIIVPWNNWAFGRNDHATLVPRGTVADI